MKDTHGQQGEGWYGFDLDGTLAKYDGWKGIDHIGEPVKPMVELMKRMHDEGKVVKIVTARVSSRDNPESVAREKCPAPDYAVGVMQRADEQSTVECMYTVLTSWGAREFIVDWCLRELGFVPEIVYQKDHLMLELYDDRVKQVVPNEGWLVEDIAASKRQKVVIDHVEFVNAKWWDRMNWLLLGAALAVAAVMVVQCFTQATRRPLPEVTEKLHNAIHEFMESQEQEGSR